jgi:hypothetical protein
MASFRTLVLLSVSFTLCACGQYKTLPSSQNATTSTTRTGSIEEPMISETRSENEDWNEALTRELKKLSALQRASSDSSASVIRSAKPYSPDMNVATLPEWTGSSEALMRVFLNLRDERHYSDPNRNFKRRATWLYPRDGCYVRATHSAQSAARSGYVRPGKVFAFGSLRFASRFASGGVVYWSYHVAAAYRNGRTTLILDPALNPAGPIDLAKWISKMHQGASGLKLSVCDSYAYGIYHPCTGGGPSQERSFSTHMRKFLPLEWSNVRARGFDPMKVLGDDPPWPLFDLEAYFDLFFPGARSAASFLSPNFSTMSEGV